VAEVVCPEAVRRERSLLSHKSELGLSGATIHRGAQVRRKMRHIVGSNLSPLLQARQKERRICIGREATQTPLPSFSSYIIPLLLPSAGAVRRAALPSSLISYLPVCDSNRKISPYL
jgi:hypothetical protein